MSDFFNSKAWFCFKYCLQAALIVLLIYIFCRYILVWFIPFIVAFIVARLVEPVIKICADKLHMSRKTAAAAITIITYSVLGFLIYFASFQLISQFKGFSSYLPVAIDGISSRLSQLSTFFSELMDKLPADLSQTIFNSVTLGLQNLKEGINIPYIKLLGGLKRAAFSVPSIFVSVIATVISTYFIASDYHSIGSFITRQMPEKASSALRKVRSYLSEKLLCWLKAQLFLVFITFSELTIGFILLRIEYAGILALIVAVIDMLPILGVGTVLIPWGVINLILGDYSKGAALLILYVIIALIRNIIEPKIVGQSLGLHPLATLICIYIGLQLFGFAGMFLFPLAAITIVQMSRWGYIKNPFAARSYDSVSASSEAEAVSQSAEKPRSD